MIIVIPLLELVNRRVASDIAVDSLLETDVGPALDWFLPLTSDPTTPSDESSYSRILMAPRCRLTVNTSCLSVADGAEDLSSTQDTICWIHTS